MRRATFVLAVVLFVSGAALADTLYLKDGTKFDGVLVSDAGGIVKFKTAGGILEFPKEKVDRIEKGATKSDDFAARRKAIADGDVKALHELADWCGEQKMPAQRRKTLQEILKACPNHPEARRGLGQAWDGKAWVEAKTPPPDPKIEVGEKTVVPETPVSLRPPKGWFVKTENGRLSFTGPARYAVPPVLVAEFGPPADPAALFDEKAGFAKPTEAKAGPLAGSLARRATAEGGIDRAEWVAAFAARGGELRVRLSCLAMEAEVFSPALAQTLASVEVAMPKADYVNATYKYQLDLPKPETEWPWEETEDHDFSMAHRAGEPVEYATLSVIAGNPGEETKEMTEYFEGTVKEAKAGGEITRDEEIDFAGKKARLVERTTLEAGIPMLERLLRVEHGGRLYLLHFMRHEYGKASDTAWQTVLESFRFTE